MVVQVQTNEETITVSNVIFITENDESVDITTEDKEVTQLGHPEGITVFVFTDSGVQIEPTPN